MRISQSSKLHGTERNFCSSYSSDLCGNIVEVNISWILRDFNSSLQSVFVKNPNIIRTLLVSDDVVNALDLDRGNYKPLFLSLL